MPRAKSLLLLLATLPALAQQPIPTPAAAAWWRTTTALASDSMEGRDTGTPAYQRAADYVARRLQQAGLHPAGDGNTYFQTVPMHQVRLDTGHSTLLLRTPGQADTPLRLLDEVTLTPRPGISDLAIDAPLLFLGYGDTLPTPQSLGLSTFHGSAAVVFSATPAGLSTADRPAFLAHRAAALAAAGFSVLLFIDNPAAVEPFHWPAAYSRSVSLRTSTSTPPHPDAAPLQLRISADAAARLFRNAPSHSYPELLQFSESGVPLPGFPLSTTLHGHLVTTEQDIASPNVLALLPGSDPALAPEVVAVSAHLDGYGFGTPVLGDSLYNGALDDAAYVSTLLELADTLHHASAAQQPHRSILFCIFTGEEKGLLGSLWYTTHPTIPLARTVADLNLDQLRPIFPLRILTMEGLSDSSLGNLAQTVAKTYSIELRPDQEPERNLFRRADNFNFVRSGIPIASFIFGYDPGSPEEHTYRDWYARRYHKPQDDLSTPIDWSAAVRFNSFFHDLTLAVADTPVRPQWSPTSPWAPHTSPSPPAAGPESRPIR